MTIQAMLMSKVRKGKLRRLISTLNGIKSIKLPGFLPMEESSDYGRFELDKGFLAKM